MSGRVTIGDAWVALHADSDGLRREIRRAVDEATKGQKFTIPITADSKGLRNEIQRAINEAAAGQKFTIPLTVDSGGLRQEIRRAVAAASVGQYADIKMRVDRSQVDELQNALSRLASEGSGKIRRFTDDNESSQGRFRSSIKKSADEADSFAKSMSRAANSMQWPLSLKGTIAAAAGAMLPVLAQLVSSLSLASSSLAGLAPAALIGAGAFGLIKAAISSPIPALKDLESQWGKTFKDISSGGLQKGMVEFLERTKANLPSITSGLQRLSNALGGVAHHLADVTSSARFGKQFENIFTLGSAAVDRMGGALAAMLRIFMSVSSAAAPLMVRFSGWLSDSLQKLAKITEAGESSGKLQAFFKRAGDEMAKWGKILGNLSIALFNIFHIGGQGSSDMASNLVRVTDQFQRWTRSVEGAEKIKKFFDFIHNIDWMRVIKTAIAVRALMAAFQVLNGVIQTTTVLLRALGLASLANPVGIAIVAIAALAAGFLLLYTKSKPFHDFINQKVLPLLRALGSWIKTNILPVFMALARTIGGELMKAFRDIQKIMREHHHEMETVGKVLKVFGIIAGVTLVVALKILAFVLGKVFVAAILVTVAAIRIGMVALGGLIWFIGRLIANGKDLITWAKDTGRWFAWLGSTIKRLAGEAFGWVVDRLRWMVTVDVALVRWMYNQWTALFDAIKTMILKIVSFWISWFAAKWLAFILWVVDKVTWLHDKFWFWFDKIRTTVVTLIHDAVERLKLKLIHMATWIVNKMEEIHTGWVKMWQKIGAVPGKILHKVISEMASHIGNILHLLHDAIDAINKFTSFVGITIPNVSSITAPADEGGGDFSIPGLAGGGSLAHWPAVKRAMGGGLLRGPGTTVSDSIPAMLSTEEYVVNARAAKRLGHHKLDYMNRYGEMPPTFRQGGMLPFIAHLAGGGSAAADAIIAVARKSGIPFNPTSTFRAGSVSTSGNRDYHSQGLAVDMSSSPANMARLASYFMGYAPALLEEIHSGGGGFFVKNGQRVGASFYGAEVPLHFDHVHIAAYADAMNQILGGHMPAGLGTPSGGGASGGWGGFDALLAKVMASVNAAIGAVEKQFKGVLGKMPNDTPFDKVWKGIVGKIPGPLKDKITQAGSAMGGGGPNSGDLGDLQVEKLAWQTAKSMGASDRVILALFEAGLVESGFRNLQTAVDHDSLGFLQQRPSAGWPSPLNVPTATRSFVSRAMAADHGGGTAGQLAQRVQVSAFPARYDQAQGRAMEAIRRVAGMASAGKATSGVAGLLTKAGLGFKFADGGMVGDTSSGLQAFRSGGVVKGLPGVDNVPIMASRNERVLTESQNRAWEAGKHGLTVNGDLNITIPAKDVKEMQDVAEFFDRLPRLAKAGGKTRQTI